MKAAGKKAGDYILVGFDAAPGEITAILAGEETASVAQYPAKIGSMGIDAAYQAASGKTIASSIDTGTEVVTKDNAAQFK